MTRLETLSPELAGKLRCAAAAKQRAASMAASEFAVCRSKVEHVLVEKALEKLRTANLLTTSERVEIEALAAQLDEEYFDLKELAEEGIGNQEEYWRVFAKARAVAALFFAGDKDSLHGATESIYEAAATIESDDKIELFALVASVLE